MKLRNKKTGEIVETDLKIKSDDGFGWKLSARNLVELNAEWEDYEEPKEYWFISTTGKPHRFEGEDKTYTPDRKQLGNYFETKEEAEKAVEKLKAWKRLKDNGFKFEGTNNHKRRTGYFINYYLGKSFNSQDECEQAMKDLDLLLGGEE